MITRRLFIASALLSTQAVMTPANADASFFSALQHQQIIADPGRIRSLWLSDGFRFKSSLGPGFRAESDEYMQFGFCAMVAHDLKPYVRCTTVDLRAMLNASGLDCDNYVALTWMLFNLLVEEQTLTVAAVGWDGGSIGNHAQLFLSPALDAGKEGNWLLDPTIGTFQCGYDFDAICSGKACSESSRADLYQRSGTVTDWLHEAVIRSLREGLYRPSNLLYYFEDLSSFLKPPPIETWPTPRGALVRRATKSAASGEAQAN